MIGWHDRLNGHEFEQTPGDSEAKGNLACCSPWGCRELDMTQRLNNNNPRMTHYETEGLGQPNLKIFNSKIKCKCYQTSSGTLKCQ